MKPLDILMGIVLIIGSAYVACTEGCRDVNYDIYKPKPLEYYESLGN